VKHLIYFLLISLFLSSCGTSSSFSKRKHLPGHHWNKSGVNACKKGDHKDVALKSQNDAQKNGEVILETAQNENELQSVDDRSEIEALSDSEDINVAEESTLSKTIARTIKVTHINSIAHTGTTSALPIIEPFPRKEKGPEETFMTMFVLFYVAIALFFIGLIIVVLWAILQAFELAGISLLIVGLSISGVALAFIIICIVLLMSA
jgi:hypothetical protein